MYAGLVFKKRFSLFFITVLFLLSAKTLSITDTTQRLYPIPEHGQLKLQVPTEWEVSYLSLGETKPPVITFYRQNEVNQEIFQLNLSILWDDGYSRDITNPETIRKLVEDSGQSTLPSSEEQSLKMEEFEGSSGHGYYFNLTDAMTPRGEYKYLLQGALNVGTILVVFSLFTRDVDSNLMDQTLMMIKTATHEFQPDV